MTAMRRAGFLDGHILIAMPGMADERFVRSLVFLCAHSDDGAMGIILNQLAPGPSFADLLDQLEIVAKPRGETGGVAGLGVRVHHGGPVETGRGFVLHSSDYFLENATLPISEAVALTTTLEVLKAIADGRGPARALLALGYAGWAPGQLEQEIQQNGWLICAADPGLLFDSELETKYDRAMRKLGVDLAMLSHVAGHA
jgi:putative transcriptional regulator